MAAGSLKQILSSPEATAHKASLLSQALGAGDVVLLEGDIGAGKTHFCRALIHTALGWAEDVPSPTFTLVQTYPLAEVEIWHTDLYRLSSTQEIEELGLFDAFETEICLVEWPDRLGSLAPASALTLNLSLGDAEQSRILTAQWTDPRWPEKLAAWSA